MASDSLTTLSGRLCAWLRAPLNALETAYLEGRLGHAWLIAGPPGLGKVNLALAFADRVLRGQVGTALPAELPPREALDAMRNRHAPTDHHPDLHWIFPAEDKRSIGVEQIRAVIETLALKGFRGGAKIVVIEPAQAMTVAAANALLKALEEPSPGTYMLLVSQQPGRLPSTIRSRCQTLPVRGPRTGARAAPAPLVAAERDSDDYRSNINELEKSINLIYEYRRDPQAVADEWLHGDLGTLLEWLGDQIRSVIRGRVRAAGSTAVTVGASPLLHNYWPALTLAKLFEQLAAADKLRDQLDSGINAELALRVLLLGFIPERGRL
jgi:DNA polymerase-3 subunit delta'